MKKHLFTGSNGVQVQYKPVRMAKYILQLKKVAKPSPPQYKVEQPSPEGGTDTLYYSHTPETIIDAPDEEKKEWRRYVAAINQTEHKSNVELGEKMLFDGVVERPPQGWLDELAEELGGLSDREIFITWLYTEICSGAQEVNGRMMPDKEILLNLIQSVSGVNSEAVAETAAAFRGKA